MSQLRKVSKLTNITETEAVEDPVKDLEREAEQDNREVEENNKDLMFHEISRKDLTFIWNS